MQQMMPLIYVLGFLASTADIWNNAEIVHITECTKEADLKPHRPHLIYQYSNNTLQVTFFDVEKSCGYPMIAQLGGSVEKGIINIRFNRKPNTSVVGCSCSYDITILIKNILPGSYTIKTPHDDTSGQKIKKLKLI